MDSIINNIRIIKSLGKKVAMLRKSILQLNLILGDTRRIICLDVPPLRQSISLLTEERLRLERQIAKLLKSQYGDFLDIGDEFHISSFDIENDICLLSFCIADETIDRYICLSTGKILDFED